MFAKVIKENQRDWSEWVPYVTFCYNATVHSSTGFSSFFFIFTGRQLLWNVDLIFLLSPEGALTVPQYATEVERLDKAWLGTTCRPQLTARAGGTTLNPGHDTSSRGPLFVSITPVELWRGLPSGSRFTRLRVKSLRKLMMPRISSEANAGKHPKSCMSTSLN